MKFRSVQAGIRPRLMMTPLIDVVFLLLIFLMSAHLGRRVRELEASLPRHKGLVPSQALTEELKARQIWVRIEVRDGRRLIVVNQKEVPDFDELYLELVLLQTQIEEPVAVLDCQPELVLEDMVLAYNACRAADYTEITFAFP